MSVRFSVIVTAPVISMAELDTILPFKVTYEPVKEIVPNGNSSLPREDTSTRALAAYTVREGLPLLAVTGFSKATPPYPFREFMIVSADILTEG
jgi:hypothetical protein